MGLEGESCRFEAAVVLLREFVCGCVCVRSGGRGEAYGALQVLQEIYQLYTNAFTQGKEGTSLDEINIKKEIANDFPADEFLDEDKCDIKYDYDDDHQTYFSEEMGEGGADERKRGRRGKSKKKKEKDKTRKVKKHKHKLKDEKKLKVKKKLLSNLLEDIVIKTEEDIVNDVNVGSRKVKKLVRGRRPKDKDGLSKTAKTKMLVLMKRQEKDEHYRIFGKKYVCGVCNKSFAVKVFLERHVLKEHGTQGNAARWECDECGKFYASKRQLERHKMIHRGEKSFQCEICGRGFDTYDTRYIHQFVHMDNKYICDHCGKVYRQRRHLVQHMKNHNGYIWKCKDCGKVFDTQRKWLYHKKNHSGTTKKKQCDICGATFAASSSIRNHMMIHLGHKPYQCSQCDMSFVQAGGLRTHEKTHNNTSRTHRCELCGKMMTSKGLAYHLMVHEGSRPFKCDKCSKAFVTDFKLRKHKKIHLRLGHYKSEEEAGILKPRRKSSSCLPKDELHPPQQPTTLPTFYPSVSSTIPTELHIPYINNC